eukprot:354551-Chlamydomonas_euryale.AAC.9
MYSDQNPVSRLASSRHAVTRIATCVHAACTQQPLPEPQPGDGSRGRANPAACVSAKLPIRRWKHLRIVSFACRRGQASGKTHDTPTAPRGLAAPARKPAAPQPFTRVFV